ncbi:MAG: hypothetical protein ACRYGK_02240, partial [Janthinobacterium lividum]
MDANPIGARTSVLHEKVSPTATPTPTSTALQAPPAGQSTPTVKSRGLLDSFALRATPSLTADIDPHVLKFCSL